MSVTPVQSKALIPCPVVGLEEEERLLQMLDEAFEEIPQALVNDAVAAIEDAFPFLTGKVAMKATEALDAFCKDFDQLNPKDFKEWIEAQRSTNGYTYPWATLRLLCYPWAPSLPKAPYQATNLIAKVYNLRRCDKEVHPDVLQAYRAAVEAQNGFWTKLNETATDPHARLLWINQDFKTAQGKLSFFKINILLHAKHPELERIRAQLSGKIKKNEFGSRVEVRKDELGPLFRTQELAKFIQHPATTFIVEAKLIKEAFEAKYRPGRPRKDFHPSEPTDQQFNNIFSWSMQLGAKVGGLILPFLENKKAHLALDDAPSVGEVRAILPISEADLNQAIEGFRKRFSTLNQQLEEVLKQPDKVAMQSWLDRQKSESYDTPFFESKLLYSQLSQKNVTASSEFDPILNNLIKTFKKNYNACVHHLEKLQLQDLWNEFPEKTIPLVIKKMQGHTQFFDEFLKVAQAKSLPEVKEWLTHQKTLHQSNLPFHRATHLHSCQCDYSVILREKLNGDNKELLKQHKTLLDESETKVKELKLEETCQRDPTYNAMQFFSQLKNSANEYHLSSL
jgi:hypothetical protein